MAQRKNINRGYMKLIVWQDAKALIESLQEKQQAGGWCETFRGSRIKHCVHDRR